MEKNMDGALLQGGKYQIKRFISSGGFGCTYEGVHNQLKIRVAIKEFFVREYCHRDEAGRITLNTEQHRPTIERLKSKFLDEARALAGMYHEGIVHVYDVFEENGSAYYVMDYIDGVTLYDHVQKFGPMSQLDAVSTIAKAARALEYVHNNNRLHLDIKPANIMVDKNGKVYLIDFGVSKQYDKDSKSNMSTLMGMSMGYSAIEQMSNNVKLFAPATDIYSLGATLYYLLTGTDPIAATDIASGEQLTPLPAHIHPGIAATVYRAMALNRGERSQSIEEFLATLPPASELEAGKPQAPQGPHTVQVNAAPKQQPISQRPIQQPISQRPGADYGTMPMQQQAAATPGYDQYPLPPQKKNKTWLTILLSALGGFIGVFLILILIGIFSEDSTSDKKSTSSDGHTTISAENFSSSSSSSSTSSASTSSSSTSTTNAKAPSKDDDGEVTSSAPKSDIDKKLDKAERIADKMVAGKASTNEMLELANIMSELGQNPGKLSKEQINRIDKIGKKMDKIK